MTPVLRLQLSIKIKGKLARVLVSYVSKNLYFFVLFPEVQVITRLSYIAEMGNKASSILCL